MWFFPPPPAKDHTGSAFVTSIQLQYLIGDLYPELLLSLLSSSRLSPTNFSTWTFAFYHHIALSSPVRLSSPFMLRLDHTPRGPPPQRPYFSAPFPPHPYASNQPSLGMFIHRRRPPALTLGWHSHSIFSEFFPSHFPPTPWRSVLLRPYFNHSRQGWYTVVVRTGLSTTSTSLPARMGSPFFPPIESRVFFFSRHPLIFLNFLL